MYNGAMVAFFEELTLTSDVFFTKMLAVILLQNKDRNFDVILRAYLALLCRKTKIESKASLRNTVLYVQR